MKTSRIGLLSIVATAIFLIVIASTDVFAAGEAVTFTINSALPGGSTVAAIGLRNVSDIESFSLELTFASGSTLSLPATNWFSRDTAYFPSATLPPPYDKDSLGKPLYLNDLKVSSAGNKVYISGFKPTGTSGNIGAVAFKVSDSATTCDAVNTVENGQCSFQSVAVSGKYFSSTKQQVISFAPVSQLFITGTAVNGICGSANGLSTPTIPTSNLCSSPAAATTPVWNAGANRWDWTCPGTDGGTTASCSAPLADTTAPNLSVSTLQNGAYTNNATLNVSGTVTDSDGVKSLTVNGTAVTVNADGSFNTAVILTNGANTITVIATDNVNNQKNDIRTITFEPVVPVITITAPADNSTVNKSTVDVSGSVNESATVAVTANSVAAQSFNQTGNNFNATVNLAQGLNTIKVSATNLAGNTASAKRTVTADMAAPALAITGPGEDLTIHTNNITISGTVTDLGSGLQGLTLTCDGQTYTPTVAADGTFSQSLSFTTEKNYAVVITAVDVAGKSASVQRNIIYKTQTVATGDVNGDKTINVFDALLSLQYAVGLFKPADETAFKATADVAPLDSNGKPKGDLKVDVFDALAILRHAVGLDGW